MSSEAYMEIVKEAVDALKAKFDAGVSLQELLDALPEIYKMFPPTVYYITAFDDTSMEHKRAFTGKRPAPPFIEPSTEDDSKVHIARIRDDGVKLYYHDIGTRGHWTRRPARFEREQADKLLWYIEKAAGRPGYYGHDHDRCFGMYYDRQQAIDAVERNSMDMHECLYTWIVVQRSGGHGVHPMIGDESNDDQIWFKWEPTERPEDEDYNQLNSGYWMRTERPEETKHIMCFSPVG